MDWDEGDYEVITDDFVFAVERQDEIDGSWSPVFWQNVDVNWFNLRIVDWDDLKAKGVTYDNATWRAALYGGAIHPPPLETTAPRRLGHSVECFKPAYEAGSNIYKKQNGFSHRHLPGAGRDAADLVVRA